MPQPVTLGNHAPRLTEVRDLLTKAGRRTHGRYTIEGRTMLEEALRSGLPIEALYATEAAYATIASLVAETGAEQFIVADRALARISDLESPPGIVAVVRARLAALEELLAQGEPVLALAGISDPGNAGTLLRSAEIFGVERVVFPAGGLEPYQPKVVRGSMGAIFRLQLAVTSAEELLAVAARQRYHIVAAAGTGTPLPEVAWPQRLVLAIGNERHGVSGWLPRYDAEVAIPQKGAGESLNAAIAGSIILYVISQHQQNAAKQP